MSTLGDVGPHDDASYTGDYTPGNPVTLDYYREKARQFQVMLNALDASYRAVQELLASPAAAELDEDTGLFLYDWLYDFDQHKTQLLGTAEAVNAGSAIVNSLGGRMPQLSIPGTLGLAPLVIPAAAIAWIAAAAILTTWGFAAINGLNDRLSQQQLFDAMSPEAKSAAALAASKAADAKRAADMSPWSSLAGSIKWIALAALGFIAWRAAQGAKLLK